MTVGGQRHDPAALPPGKTRYPLCRKPVGAQDRFGLVRKTSPPTGIRSSDRSAGSESLYRLSYPGPLNLSVADHTMLTNTKCRGIVIIVLVYCTSVATVGK